MPSEGNHVARPIFALILAAVAESDLQVARSNRAGRARNDAGWPVGV